MRTKRTTLSNGTVMLDVWLGDDQRHEHLSKEDAARFDAEPWLWSDLIRQMLLEIVEDKVTNPAG